MVLAAGEFRDACLALQVFPTKSELATAIAIPCPDGEGEETSGSSGALDLHLVGLQAQVRVYLISIGVLVPTEP